MISRYQYQGLTWIDLESPTHEEVQHLAEEFSIPPLVANELLTNTARSKVDLYDDLMYIILHFPSVKQQNKVGIQEVDFIVGKKFIITTRYELVDSLHSFSKTFEAQALNDHPRLPEHSGIIFMQMVKELYHHSAEELELMTETLEKIENNIFRGHEHHMVRTISFTARRLLDFRQAMRLHKDILTSFETASKQFFGNGYDYYVSSMIAEYNKVYGLLEGHRDTLTELQRTNDSLLSTKTNDIMKLFTVLSFVTFPLMLITGIFGMNTVDEVVFIKNNADFFFVIGAMLLASFIMFLFFKVKRWL